MLKIYKFGAEILRTITAKNININPDHVYQVEIDNDSRIIAVYIGACRVSL